MRKPWGHGFFLYATAYQPIRHVVEVLSFSFLLLRCSPAFIANREHGILIQRIVIFGKGFPANEAN